MARDIEDNENAKEFWGHLSDANELSTEVKSALRAKIGAASPADIPTEVVRFDAQSLTPAQRLQARGNIRAGTAPSPTIQDEFPTDYLHITVTNINNGPVTNGVISDLANFAGYENGRPSWELEDGLYYLRLSAVPYGGFLAWYFYINYDGELVANGYLASEEISASSLLPWEATDMLGLTWACNYCDAPLFADTIELGKPIQYNGRFYSYNGEWRELLDVSPGGALGIERGGTGAQTRGAAVTNLVDLGNIASTTYTLTSEDSGRILRFTAATAVTITVAADLGDKFNVRIIQAGAGQITFVASGGVTLNSYGAMRTTIGQHANVWLNRVAASTYNLSGGLSPVLQRAFLTSDFTRAAGGGTVNITGLVLPVVAGKTYRVKTFVSFFGSGGAQIGSDVSTPTLTQGRGLNIRPGFTGQYNFTSIGTVPATANHNGSAMVDGVITPSASGNVAVNINVFTSGSCNVLAGSYLEIECLNP